MGSHFSVRACRTVYVCMSVTNVSHSYENPLLVDAFECAPITPISHRKPNLFYLHFKAITLCMWECSLDIPENRKALKALIKMYIRFVPLQPIFLGFLDFWSCQCLLSKATTNFFSFLTFFFRFPPQFIQVAMYC